jgi:hypothetical protein
MSDKCEASKTMLEHGFQLLPKSVRAQQIEILKRVVSGLDLDVRAAGQRNLLTRCPEVSAFAHSDEPFKLACDLLSAKARPVRAILFDKTPQANWYVTWHQDLTIPVKQKVEIPGFTSWSIKDGIAHVQPPSTILEQMVSLRVHLDDCAIDNGPIKFLPGTHLSGILDAQQIGDCRDKITEAVCVASASDIIAMRPLILHASSQATSAASRRVLHLEYACADLPSGLEWAKA